MLSNHDVIRHASRYGLPDGRDEEAWLLSDGQEPSLDRDFGLRRALAATLLMLALPGSSYVYQGEELGLPEVADLARESLQDPVSVRSAGRLKGRDGCRVPLPWRREGSSYGFGSGGAWLPQPTGWGELSVEAQQGVASSPLELYRAALATRRRLIADEALEWADDAAAADPGILHFRRSGGWECVANLSDEPRPLPAGELLLSSAPVTGGQLPPWTTVWLRTAAG